MDSMMKFSAKPYKRLELAELNEPVAAPPPLHAGMRR